MEGISHTLLNYSGALINISSLPTLTLQIAAD